MARPASRLPLWQRAREHVTRHYPLLLFREADVVESISVDNFNSLWNFVHNHPLSDVTDYEVMRKRGWQPSMC